MNRAITLIVAILALLAAWAQDVPQFTGDDYQGWTYNNPNVELSKKNIADGKVTLYVNDSNFTLTLISPAFACEGIDTVTATVKWYTKAFNDPRFDLSRASLTLAIDDAYGMPQDSVTCVPTTAGTRDHTLVLKVAIPHGLTTGKMRFVSWTGDVVSNGAIKRAQIAATASSGDDVLRGDVDGNGMVDVSDISVLIDYLLNGTTAVNAQGADVDNNGYIDVSDISELIDRLLNA